MAATPATHLWKPSSARALTIDSFVPVPRGAAASAPTLPNWPSKDPVDVLDYELNISPALLGNDSDAILSLDVAVAPSAPGDLVVKNVSADGTTAVIWLSGGQAGTVYTVTVLITTQAGRTLQRSVLLPVLLLSASMVPGNALQTAGGAALVDQNGNPVLISS